MKSIQQVGVQVVYMHACMPHEYLIANTSNLIATFIFAISTDRRKSSTSNPTPPQRLVEQFSFEQLHSVMASNHGTALGLYDEMSTMYEQLDVYKHAGSRQDRFTLLKLYNGSSWARTFRSVSARVPRTAFNMSGFIQPGLLLEQLQKSDVDGFNDRQLFDCPAEIDPMYDQFTPFNSSGITFKEVFEQIMEVHCSPEEHIYHLSEDGMSAFTSFHDDIVIRRQCIPDDENRRGVLSKAKGQLARVALVLHAMEQAVSSCVKLHKDNDSYPDEWSFTIQATTVERAVELINHFIQQKFALMPAEEKFEETDPGLAQLSLEQRKFVSINGTYIRKLLLSKHASLTPSVVSQLRLMPPTTNTETPSKTRYPVSEAKRFLSMVVDLGLGTLQTERKERMTPKGPVAGKQSIRMLKRKYSDLQPETHAILKRIKLTEQEYKSATSPTTQQSASASPQEVPLSDENISNTPLSAITNTLP